MRGLPLLLAHFNSTFIADQFTLCYAIFSDGHLLKIEGCLFLLTHDFLTADYSAFN